MIQDCWIAFLVGGLLCAIGQVLIDYTKLTPARILTGYVVAGVLLSAVGLYPITTLQFYVFSCYSKSI